MSRSARQCSAILAFLRQGGTFTRLEGWRLFNTWATNSRVADLRKRGVPIKTTMVRFENIDGSTSKVARYSLESEELGGE